MLYTGDGATTKAITGVGFQPDLTWIKDSSSTESHVLVDAVRGANNYLTPDTTAIEVDDNTMVASLDSDGFTIGDDSRVNTSSDIYPSWNWKANGASTVTNNDGTTESEVSVNSTAGFSIVTYTGDGANATVGHGLSEVPTFLMIKNRHTDVSDWRGGSTFVSGKTYADGNGYYYEINDSKALTNPGSAVLWGSSPANPTATVFSVGPAHVSTNKDTYSYVAYAFHSVEGYSKVGIYTGNNNADGTFVYTGFRPEFLMVKSTGDTGKWNMFDNKRNTYNVVTSTIRADIANPANTSNDLVDFVSNGFKWRNVSWGEINSSYIYTFLAFAESPFKYSNAR